VTTPKINTIKRGDTRFYVGPSSGEKVPGVTSVVGMLPKSFLRYWAAKEVATTAVDSLPTVLQMILADQRDAAIDFLKKSPDRNTRKAADTGTAAHDLFERMSRGQELGRYHPDLEPFVRHFDEYLRVVKPEYHMMEETVWSDTHKYAGSFDAYATISGERVWLDNKTTRSGIHEEVGIQLAAYRFAESIIQPDGSTVPVPEADGGAVVHVRPDGWKLVPVKCDAEMFDVFLHLREAFRYEKEIKSGVIGATVAYGPTEDTPAPKAPTRRAPKVKVAA